MQTDLPNVFYHGSYTDLDAGTVMTGRGDAYEAAWKETGFYGILEQHRPKDCLAHKDAVFMVAQIDDIDLAGGATDWVFELKPEGPVSRHDLNWSTEVSCLISDGFAADSPEVEHAAKQYWGGIPHSDESVWEYLTASATVERSYMFDDAPHALSF